MLSLSVFPKTWPIRGEFRLSRGSRTEVHTLQMEIKGDGVIGRAEAVPYARYGESIESVQAQIEAVRSKLTAELKAEKLLELLPPGAARNLCDLALWDWRAKALKKPVWQLAGLPAPTAIITAYTLSLAEPEIMAKAAEAASLYPILKLKLGTPDDRRRLEAIRAARPDAQLIVDANEGWSMDDLQDLTPTMASCGVVLCEQPLPAGKDQALAGQKFPFVVCADESVHTAKDVAALADRYQAVNIKLDKAGGLTEAIKAMDAAKREGLQIMVGCMLASSLALAPAVLLAGSADWVDLDGPLLLAADHEPRLDYDGARLLPPKPGLWG